MNEAMQEISAKLINVLTSTQNSQAAVDKGIFFLRGYFADEQGERRVLNFIEAYQKQYTKKRAQRLYAVSRACHQHARPGGAGADNSPPPASNYWRKHRIKTASFMLDLLNCTIIC